MSNFFRAKQHVMNRHPFNSNTFRAFLQIKMTISAECWLTIPPKLPNVKFFEKKADLPPNLTLNALESA